MSDSALKSSTSLERAVSRLAEAVGRLEQAMEVIGDGSSCQREADVEAALTERARLRETQAVVAAQLDATIARLRGVLGG